MNIAELSIKRPVFIVMIIMSIITLGIIGYSRLPVDLLPDVEYPTLVVVTEYEGASSTEIETLITKPLETALANVEGLDTLSSTSREGRSQVYVTFKMGVDVKFSELKVREKVERAKRSLPDDVEDPVVNRFSTDDMPIIFLSIQGNRSLSDLREILENTIQPKIESIDGVGSITIQGAQQKIIRITVNADLLRASGLTYNQIQNAITRKNVSLPVGSVRPVSKFITARVYGKAQTISDIADLTISSSSGKIFKISDVAKVEMSSVDPDTRARVKKDNAVMFRLYKQSGSNTVEVSNSLRAELPNIQKLIPPDVQINIVSDSATAINRSIKGVQEDIVLGAFLAVIIVWLFLGNFRSTIITAIALPNSIIGAFFLAYIAGFSINTMTLLALSISVGLLIDDSIVVRENIFRYIEHGYDPKTAAIKGTNEVGLAVLSTTLSIMAVFIPISFLQGVIGQFFKEIGFTIAFALGISLIDAFTSAPMLSAYWFKHTDKVSAKGFHLFFVKISNRWNVVYERINAFYHRILLWSLDHKIRVIIPIILLFIASIFTSRYIGTNFMSNTDSGTISFDVQAYPGASFDEVDQFLIKIEDFVSKQKEVDSFYTTLGVQGSSNQGSVDIDLKPVSERNITTQDMITRLRQFTRGTLEKNLVIRITERASMGNIGGRGGNRIQLVLNGADLKVLDDLSLKIYNVISGTPGVTDTNSSLQPGNPEIVIKLDPLKAEKLGFNEYDLGTSLRDLVQGVKISAFTIADKEYDIILRLNEEDRDSIEDIKNIIITGKSGIKVPLSAIADFSYSSSPVRILRENKQRIIRINANIADGYSMSDVISRIDSSIAKHVVFPNGYGYYYSGQQKQFADLQSQIVYAVILALIFMYMILASLYNSFIQPIVLMVSIPLAIIGSYLALLLTNVDLDIYGYIGLMLVMGLVAKNAILLIDFTNKKREDGMTIRDALLHASPIRLRPILMTSFAMIFGMLPLALGMNEGSRGREALPVTVIGGIVTSTFLTLIAVPILYEWVEKLIMKRKMNVIAPSEVITAITDKMTSHDKSGVKPQRTRRKK
ncbi:MAG: efflux RND transporter permease subunit [Spirochaetes bacterium]|nr:efflux RND transporter permease subunit [Spirochaetota bacterium]